MRILLLGGNGRTGLRVIDMAIARGHTLTALVRDPDSVKARANLTIVKGTPVIARDVSKAFEACGEGPPESVIVTLNPSRGSDSPFSRPLAPPRLLADSVLNVCNVMTTYKTSKIVVMQALGVGDSFPNLSFFMRWVARNTYMAASYTDHNLVDREIKQSGVNYILVRPPWLSNGPERNIRVFGSQGHGIGSFATVSRDSVAKFMIEAVETSIFDRSTPVIATDWRPQIALEDAGSISFVDQQCTSEPSTSVTLRKTCTEISPIQTQCTGKNR